MKNWRSWFKSTYTLGLEAEVERLRGELHDWQQLALTKEGLPRLGKREEKAFPKLRTRTTPSQWIREAERMTTPLPKENPDA